MSRSFVVLAFSLVAACQPFGTEDTENAGAATVEPEAPEKTVEKTTASPVTTTSPTMPADRPPVRSPVSFDCTGALLCEDFELEPSRWAGFEPVGDDILERTGPSASTGVFSLLVGVRPDQGGDTTHSEITAKLGVRAKVDLAFSIRSATFGTGGHTDLARLAFGASVEVVIVAEEDHIGLVVRDDRRKSFDFVNSETVPLNRWNRVKLTADLSTKTTSLLIDDRVVVAGDTLSTMIESAGVTLAIGAGYSEVTTPIDLRFDDIRVDAK